MLIPFSHGGLWGYLSLDGQVAIQPRFEWACGFSEGLAAAKLDQKQGFIDPSGSWAIPHRYDGSFIFKGHGFSNGLAPVSHSGKQGFVNTTGDEVVPVVYKQVHPFSEGLAVVCRGRLWGAVDAQGNERLPLQFDAAKTALKQGLLGVKRDFKVTRRIGTVESATWKWGFVDAQARERIPFDYKAVRSFSEDLAAVCNWQLPGKRTTRVGLYGYVDRQGELRIRHKFDYAYPFEQGRALIKEISGDIEKFGLIDTRGNLLVPPQYDDAKRVSAERIAVQSDGLFGLLDLDGKTVVEPRFTRLGDFASGLAPAATGGEEDGLDLKGARWSYIDPEGNEAFATGFDACGSFHDELAVVSYQGKQSLINPKGQMVLQFWCEALSWPAV